MWLKPCLKVWMSTTVPSEVTSHAPVVALNVVPVAWQAAAVTWQTPMSESMVFLPQTPGPDIQTPFTAISLAPQTIPTPASWPTYSHFPVVELKVVGAMQESADAPPHPDVPAVKAKT